MTSQVLVGAALAVVLAPLLAPAAVQAVGEQGSAASAAAIRTTGPAKSGGTSCRLQATVSLEQLGAYPAGNAAAKRMLGIAKSLEEASKRHQVSQDNVGELVEQAQQQLGVLAKAGHALSGSSEDDLSTLQLHLAGLAEAVNGGDRSRNSDAVETHSTKVRAAVRTWLRDFRASAKRLCVAHIEFQARSVAEAERWWWERYRPGPRLIRVRP